MSSLKVFGQPEEVKNVSLIGWIPNCFASTLTLFFSQDSEEPQNAVRLTPCNLRALDHTMKVPLSGEVLLRVDLKNEESKSSFEYIDLDCEDRTLLKELIKQTPVLLTNNYESLLKGGRSSY